MKKIISLIVGYFACTAFFISCDLWKKASVVQKFNPDSPVEISNFMPDSGGIRTKFIINGSNFGSDKANVKLTFTDSEGNERPALIIKVIPTVIYAQVPRQAGGLSSIKLSVFEKNNDGEIISTGEARWTETEKQFKYIVKSAVSTVVGKAQEAGNNNGTLGETTFTTPRYVAIDNDENIMIFDNPRTRLSSIRDNKTITLYEGGALDQPFFLDKERTQLLVAGDAAATGCFLFDAKVNWVADRYGQLLENGGWMHSVILAPCDSSYIIYRRNTGQLYAQKFRKGMRYSGGVDSPTGSVRKIGVCSQGGSNGHLAYNPVDHYIYCSLHNKHGVYRFKVKKGEDGWPELDGEVEAMISNGAGYKDGAYDEAQFFEPRGIAIDSEGNIFIADTKNHKIRKIDIKAKMVTTVAGSNKGYKDGEPLDAEFNEPFGIFFDKDDVLYIADSQNHCIRKLAIE